MITEKELEANLPKGFDYSIPKKAFVVYVRVLLDVAGITADAAKKIVSKLCKTFKLKESYSNVYDEGNRIEWNLVDVAGTKEMVTSAKDALKLMKNFFSKYREAYRYSDDACAAVREMISIVEND